MTVCVISAVGWFFFGDSIQQVLRRYNFQGMTREQVTTIIGGPDKTEYFKDWDMVLGTQDTDPCRQSRKVRAVPLSRSAPSGSWVSEFWRIIVELEIVIFVINKG